MGLNFFHVGASVEVLFDDAGFEMSWAGAIVTRSSGPDFTCSIKYNDFFNDEQGQTAVVEEVDCQRLRPALPANLRPPHPFPLHEYRVGNQVDHWHEVRVL